MGGALACAVASSGVADVLLYDRDTEKAKALGEKIGAAAVGLDALCAECDVIFLGVKPNIIPSLIEDIRDAVRADALVVSMAAAVDIKRIEDSFKRDVKVVRIMPNTPASVGEGMILFAANAAAECDIPLFLEVLAKAGTLDRLDERLIDAAACISGCGPAFVYMFIEALADGGVAAGLPRDKAMQYAAETAIGAATVVLESGKHPGELKDAVCSPGGSTIEGVLTLESGGMRGIVSDAVISAYEKTKKLGK